jgi:hypothetical protein
VKLAASDAFGLPPAYYFLSAASMAALSDS